MRISIVLLCMLIINEFYLNPPDLENIEDQTRQKVGNYQVNKKAYFASGCFWCVEHIFESLVGVNEVYSGYSGGETKNPTYYEVIRGKTGHAESVEVVYDPKVISFMTLIKVLFESHDPTLIDQQGPDKGTHYRSIAFYQNLDEKKVIQEYIKKLEFERIFESKIVTEIKPFKKFYYAEEFHQNYEMKNPNDLYILNVSRPRFNMFKSKSSTPLKK